MILCYVTDRKSISANHPPSPPAASSAAAFPARSAPADDAFAPLLVRIAAAASAGVDWIQLREKDLTARDCAALTAATLMRCRASQTKVAVNDRLDVALAGFADAVHLGERSLTVAAVCRHLGHSPSSPRNSPLLIGVSCHSLVSAVAAAEAGAGYIFFGPVFATPSKRAYGPAQGLPLLTQVCRAVSIPVLAIGGVTAENTSACLSAGAAGLAAIRLFQEPSDVAAVVATLRAAR